MLDLLLFLVTAWAATAAGRAGLRLLRLEDGPTRLERNLFGLALGLGMLAYGMLALGLVGGLYRPAGVGLLLLLAGLGFRQHPAMARELQDTFRPGIRLPPWGWAVAVLFLMLVLIPLVGVWTPPVLALRSVPFSREFYTEWDSISYHLADPKLYLQAHRIYYIPWESHSNFAFTAEMWYLFGLMERGTEGGIPLAKLFHFTCGIGACLAVYAFGMRHLTAKTGLLAAGILASTPLVLWEAGTAYADLVGAFFATLTLFAVANGMANRDERWLRLGAVLMGLTLSTKATALGTVALLAVGLLFWWVRMQGQTPLRAVAKVVVWCLLALAVGSPWYIKSAVYTGNPVYPFYSRIFPSHYWNTGLGDAYDASNAGFGVGATVKEIHSPTQAVLAPWNLTMYLLPGHPPSLKFHPFNDFQSPLAALSPLLLAALFFPAFIRGASGVVRALGLYALCSLILWFVTAEYVRYLLPTLPAFCLLAAWVVARVWEARWRSRYALAGLGVCSVAFTLYVGVELVLLQAPVVFGGQSRDDYITHGFPPYPAMQFINQQLPPGTKLVFYGNPFGFYCDKPYLWGDAQHSTFIPYDTFHDADGLRASLAKIGVTHILVNWRPGNFPKDASVGGEVGWVYALTDGAGPPLFEAHGVAVYALPEAKPQ